MTDVKHKASRACYVGGCRLPQCCEANKIYQQQRKKNRRSASLTAVTSLPGRDAPQPTQELDPPPGRVEQKVVAELATLSAAQKQPGLVEAMLQMARIMDAPDLATTHPSAMRQLMMGLEKLRAASVGRSGKLADVAAMSQRVTVEKTKTSMG